ncbi:unannotated protein [freshwater metagenome]|uniref:Unannotated protein n=1 Tax=freshwater metagenome TaxID=449393 RepID=A0A6J7HJA2_9ZZZZ
MSCAVAVGMRLRYCATTAATSGAENDVPDASRYPPSGQGRKTSVPGAMRSTEVAPQAENADSVSAAVELPTDTIAGSGSDAGYMGVASRSTASLPAAATTRTSFAPA